MSDPYTWKKYFTDKASCYLMINEYIRSINIFLLFFSFFSENENMQLCIKEKS